MDKSRQMRTSYTLYELNEYIKRVIALNFAEPLWISCEISQVKEVRGNVYLDLVHHDEEGEEIKAQISAQIWYKSYLFIKNKLGALLPSLLKEGTHVLLKVKVEFNERYGIKLIIEDIDPSFTIGQMEMNRQKILQRLKDEGLIDVNKNKSLPRVIQRIAVISSENAAGYIDFIRHLGSNNYGYKYQTTLFPAAMQGQNTEKEVCQSLRQIEENRHLFDVILIIRGGGSKLDLAWFDNYNIGSMISKSSMPVMTGIGHDIDSTVTDMVAHTQLKTPTAVADFIIHHNMDFETDIQQSLYWISQMSHQAIKQHQLSLENITQQILWLPKDHLRKQDFRVNQVYQAICHEAAMKIRWHRDSLTLMEKEIRFSHPSHILRKGYAIIRQNGSIKTSSETFSPMEDFDIQFTDKTIKIKRNEQENDL
jgi:exodeoxyribonuclease VII large subunit